MLKNAYHKTIAIFYAYSNAMMNNDKGRITVIKWEGKFEKYERFSVPTSKFYGPSGKHHYCSLRSHFQIIIKTLNFHAQNNEFLIFFAPNILIFRD